MIFNIDYYFDQTVQRSNEFFAELSKRTFFCAVIVMETKCSFIHLLKALRVTEDEIII